MGNVEESDGDKYRAYDDNGNELENSPYDSEKAAKIALNQYKMKNDGSEQAEELEEEDDSEDDSEDKDEQPDEVQDVVEEVTDESEDEQETSSGGIPLGLVLLVAGGVLGVSYLISSSSENSQPEEVEAEEVDSETKDEDDGRKSAEELF